MKNIRKNRRWLLIGLVLMMSHAAFADGAYITLANPNFAYLLNGTSKVAVAGSVVQVIEGATSAPSATGGVRAGQTVRYTGVIGDGGLGDGEFYYFYSFAGSAVPIFIRIWPEGVGPNKYYVDSGQMYTSAAGANPSENYPASLVCNKLLSAPPGVNCSVGGYALSYNSGTGKYLPSFNISPINIESSGGVNYVVATDTSRVFYNSLNYEVAKVVGAVADWNNKKTYSSGSVAETDAANPFYIMGGEYAARLSATNDISTGPYGSETPFTIPAGEGGGPIAMILTLESNVPAGPGINFISLGMPADGSGNWYATSNTTNRTIKTAYQLVKAINEAAGGNVVSTFGKWDKTAAVQKDAGILITNKNPDETTQLSDALKAIVLQPWEGYQLYVGPLTSTGNKLEMTIKNSAQ